MGNTSHKIHEFSLFSVLVTASAAMSVLVLCMLTASLGPVYTKRQSQYCDNSAMTLMILLSLKRMESLKNGLLPHSGATPLFSMTAVSLASLLGYHRVHSGSRCTWALTDNFGRQMTSVLTNVSCYLSFNLLAKHH